MNFRIVVNACLSHFVAFVDNCFFMFIHASKKGAMALHSHSTKLARDASQVAG